MALINYKKFKITISGDSPKENGLQYGDIVIRKYFDKNVSYYSVLYVLNTGETAVIINGEEKQEKWFIGALIYGDEPGTGQPLDFARITSLSNKDRMGAMYMTAVDSDAPYLDIIDRIGFSGSINYPSSIGFYNQYDKLAYSFTGREYFSASYNEFIGSEQRIIRLTRNSVAIPIGTKVNFGMQTLKGSYADQKIIVSYKYRSSSILSFDSKVSDENDDYILMSSSLNSETEWKNEFVVFSVSNIHDNSYFKIDISPLSSEGSWIEISDFNIIPLNRLTSWIDQTKVRIGRLSGVSDGVFGALQDYGAYIQRLYASKDVNIAGTLTAGDRNGFGSTFYAGKIHKNAVQNSVNHDWGLDADVNLLQINPVGIGNVFKFSDKSTSGDNHRFNYNTPSWYQENLGKQYVFSAWFKSGNGYKEFTLDENNNEVKTFYVGEEWERIQLQFTVGSNVSNDYCFIDISGVDTNSDFYICGMQIEEGENATAYQPTDGIITPEDNAYGVWMSRGGIGGTIQNPLLKLTNDGWIKSRGDRFYITPEGDAYFEGHIEAGSGKIGVWNIGQNSIFSGTEKNILGSYTNESGSITIGSFGVRSYRWRLENDGSGALANGKINWNVNGDAFVGQWTIDADSIYVGIKKSDAGFTSSGITIHSSGAIRSMYSRIESDGKLYATNADISGKITALLGEIGAWKIDSNSIYSGTKSIDASSFSVADGSITLWSSGAISSRYFRLGVDGKIYATNVDINGKITASSGSIGAWSIDSNSIYSGVKGASNSVFTSSSGSITLWSEGAITSRYFRISTDGIMIASNVDVSGKITASLGSIGGWIVDSNSIYSGIKSLDSNSFTLSDGAITIWSSGAISSRYFRLGVDGRIYATNVDISGKIIASSGSVGSWNIDSNSIYSGTKALDTTSNTIADGSVTFWSSGSISARYFRLLSDGKIYASNVDVSGKISATSGVIGGWLINELSISGGNTIISSLGSITNGTAWSLNSDGSSLFAGGKINFTSSGEGYIGGWVIDTNSIFSGTKALNDASYTTIGNSMTIWSSGAISAFNFRVGTDGKLYATNADISGKITASSGSIGLWNISNSLFTGTENNLFGQFTSAIGSITIGSNGIRGYKWRFESDGSGSIAGGNIYWDANGLLTISGNASTASQLKVAVELWGNSFNGTEPIYGPILIKNDLDSNKNIILSVDEASNLNINGSYMATNGIHTGAVVAGALNGTLPDDLPVATSLLYGVVKFDPTTLALNGSNQLTVIGGGGGSDVEWGTPTAQYTPLTVDAITRNLSLDGHTHSQYLLSTAYTASDILTKLLTVDGAGSGLDAGLLCGRSAELFFKSRVGPFGTINDQSLLVDNSSCYWNPNTTGNPNNGYGVLLNVSDDTPWYNQFGFGTDNTIYFRQSINSDTNFGAWKTLAFTDSNVASATKLANTRYLWGNAFTGESDISGGIVINKSSVDTSEGQQSFAILSAVNDTKLQMGTIPGAFSYIQSMRHGVDWDSRPLILQPNGGKVGIGTVIPSYKLQVHNTAQNGIYVSSVSPNIVLGNNETFTSKTFNSVFGLSTSVGNFLTNSEIGDTVVASKTNILFGTGILAGVENGTIRMSIKTNGNVLIGTTTDSGYKLHVNGTFRAVGTAYFGSNLRIQDSGSFSELIGGVGKSIKFYTNDGLQNPLNLFNSGNVSIGTGTDSGYKLDVNGTFRSVGAAYLNSTLEVTGTSTFTGLLTANGGINATTGTFSSYVTANRLYTGYDAGLANSFSCSNWFRSNGATGWLNATYMAGILSDTANVVRTYSTNKFKVYNTAIDSILTLGGVTAANVVSSGAVVAGALNGTLPDDMPIATTSLFGVIKTGLSLNNNVGVVNINGRHYTTTSTYTDAAVREITAELALGTGNMTAGTLDQIQLAFAPLTTTRGLTGNIIATATGAGMGLAIGFRKDTGSGRWYLMIYNGTASTVVRDGILISIRGQQTI